MQSCCCNKSQNTKCNYKVVKRTISHAVCHRTIDNSLLLYVNCQNVVGKISGKSSRKFGWSQTWLDLQKTAGFWTCQSWPKLGTSPFSIWMLMHVGKSSYTVWCDGDLRATACGSRCDSGSSWCWDRSDCHDNGRHSTAGHGPCETENAWTEQVSSDWTKLSWHHQGYVPWFYYECDMIQYDI